MRRHRALRGALAGLLLAAAVMAAALPVGGCGGSSEAKTGIRVLFAGSLIIPFAQLETEFEAAHPEIDVNMEGHGSIQVIRHVSDLHEQADVVITADHSLIPMLLYQTEDPESGRPYADWYVIFATNEMAVAYTSQSASASEITGDNWADILTRPGVRVGSADPRLDANGYRALMLVRLAQDVYARPRLFSDMFGNAFRVPVRVVEEGGVAVIRVPEVLETTKGSDLVLRPYSVQLMPLLQSGEIDYAFEYTSVIKQHGLECVTLPPEINLSQTSMNDAYGRVRVLLDFQRFASVRPEFGGESIRYAATIPGNARSPEAAATFLAYLLGPEGQRIMAENYQPMVVPAQADNLAAVPEALRVFCSPRD